MTRNQENRKQMMDDTQAYLDKYAAEWQAIPIVGEAKNELDGLITAIDEAATVQSNSQTTFGKSKLELKKIIADKADIVNDIVEVYAIMVGDEELARRMDKSKTDLYKMPYEDFFREVKFIIDKVVELEEPLTTTYGLTTEQVTDLQTDYDDMKALNGKPREYKIKSGVATLNLEDLFSEAHTLLDKKLDNVMKLFKRTKPSFYYGYTRARIVVDD